ncbi:hypothetical protein [Mucilaginibacter sp. SP1R1]|uniref:hypothetical protein n=1 Tax=Mucilaginibacter sp. SP1R1 TaxID=2723091 RepID=UPI0016091AB4|nr:hypothetical protein [Mucilaginibacter sp. SP1R1]MBB6148842.1 hypothetical protein [Mucilaginibacter sp. SP1R1]
MKKLSLFAIVIILISIASCKKDDIANESPFNKSYNAWISYKGSVNNSYNYTINNGSVFGYGTETKIEVSNGKIISRDFTATQLRRDGTNNRDIVANWHEETSSLNTHGDQGAQLLTLDDVYMKARTIWLKADTKNNDIYFEARNNGMISNCGYVPKGCQDDCFTGISISAISAL